MLVEKGLKSGSSSFRVEIDQENQRMNDELSFTLSMGTASQ
jgi:hypothetical protein